MKTNFKTAANAAWKHETFSLSGVVRYIEKSKETNLRAYLSVIGLTQKGINYEMIKQGAGEDKFWLHKKNGERTEPKKLFSLWFVLGALKSYQELQKAAKSEAEKVAELSAKKAA